MVLAGRRSLSGCWKRLQRSEKLWENYLPVFSTFWLESIFGSMVARKIEALTEFPETLYFQELDPSNPRSFFFFSLIWSEFWQQMLGGKHCRLCFSYVFSYVFSMCIWTFVLVPSLSEEQKQPRSCGQLLLRRRGVIIWTRSSKYHQRREDGEEGRRLLNQPILMSKHEGNKSLRSLSSKHGCQSQASRSRAPEALTFAPGGHLDYESHRLISKCFCYQASDAHVIFVLISCPPDSRHPDRHSGAVLPSSLPLRDGKRVAVGEDQRAKRGAGDTEAD